jgi:nicotinate-nucleotide pyrophosphorylase (carboxylating)
MWVFRVFVGYMKFPTDYHGHLTQWKELLLRGLQDDGWQWDWTALGTVAASSNASRPFKTRAIAKDGGIWAGESLVVALNLVARELGFDGTLARSIAKDGARFKPGDTLCEWAGPARLVLALERPFLNLAQYICAIATATDRLVAEAHRACPERPPRVSSTRKTLPGYRDIAVLGVVAGGGHSHRVSLAGGVLIKENHIAAAGGIARAIEGVKSVAPHGLKIEIEVRDLGELAQALKARADGVLLDNFEPQQVREALAMIDQAGVPMMVEVSGGINKGNIASYAIEGVDVISSGSLTHSVKALDISMLAESLTRKSAAGASTKTRKVGKKSGKKK